MLKPQDVLTALKLFCLGQSEWSFRDLGAMLGLSIGETHGSIKRLKEALLLYEKDDVLKLSNRRLCDFLVHGVSSVFYPKRGAVSRGMLTGPFAPPLVERLTQTEGDIPIVWPTADGRARGESLEPLYPTVPTAAAADTSLYEMLVLVDAIRIGRARERKMAAELLTKRLVPGAEEVKEA
jgi:hypothetical protein